MKSNFIAPSIYNQHDFSTKAEIKSVDGKKGIVTGYFAHFNSLDSDDDIILPGAFLKSIQENGPASAKPRIKHIMNHNVYQPLGVLTDLKEDTTGLYYESQIGTHTLGADFIKMVESGLITEHSIGFRTIKWERNSDSDVRLLKELQLWEGSSLTAWGANSNTPLTGLKGAVEYSAEDLIEKQKALEKFCRATDASDETIEMLLLHAKQLSQIILEKSTTKPPKDDTKPDELKGFADAFTIFTNSLKN